ncbi:MAG: ThuA domain-containing protein [Victivallales bacterium]
MDKISVLLLTGQNNHDWKRSSYFCRDIMNESGRFSVTLAEHPTESLEDETSLAQYQLFFVDYNGPEWSSRAKVNYENAVRGGIGVVILHAANNMRGWIEFEKQCGLVWEKDKSGHSNYHEFKVAIDDKSHPVTRGLDDFLIWDELYHRLVNPHDTRVHVLASALSDPAQNGTGTREPMATTTQYGAGRVYNHILGHVWREGVFKNYEGEKMRTFENKAFQRLLLRGCEWAATGTVTEAINRRGVT